MSVATAQATVIAVSIPRPSILIIDDDVGFLEGAREYFAARGYDVDTSRTPEEAERILTENGKDKYQVIITDDNFGKLSKTKGHEFVLRNHHLFGKAKAVMISGAEHPSPEILQQLANAKTPYLEKSGSLKATLATITQQENQRRTNEIEQVVKKETARRIEELTGRPVAIQILAIGAAAAAAPAPQPKLEVALESLKQTLIKWLQLRGELDEPVFAYGKRIYSANEMIREVETETDVGIEHVQMLLDEFEESLEIDVDGYQYDDDKDAE